MVEYDMGAAADPLDNAYEELLSALARTDYFEIDCGLIKPPSNVYATQNLILKKRKRISGGAILDQIVFIAEKHIFRRLGMVVLAALINEQKGGPLVQIELANPASDIKFIFIDATRLKEFYSNILFGNIEFKEFRWGYRETGRHPWCYGLLPEDLAHLPKFELTDQEDGSEFLMNEENRFYLRIGGRVQSLERVVDLLLNISDIQNEQTEFVLEGEVGFRGVAPESAEVVFSLPGSVFWDCFSHELATYSAT